MKRTGVILLSMLLLPVLAGCGEKTPVTDSSAPVSRYSMGVGTVASRTMDGLDKTTVKLTSAAVVTDKDGVIRHCVLDETDFAVTLKDGKLQEPTIPETKREQGPAYKLTEKDTGGKSDLSVSWKEQARAFCTYVEGKTAGAVRGIAATDGKSTMIEGCDLVITDFIQAVSKAADAATEQDIALSDTLQLAVSCAKGADFTEEEPQYTFDMAAVELSPDGVITGCYTDEVSVDLMVTEGIFTAISGSISTKREQKDAYGMKAASPSGKEWYQHAAAFDGYAKGKKASSLATLSLNDEGRTDAISGCTIKLSGLLETTVKAAKNNG